MTPVRTALALAALKRNGRFAGYLLGWPATGGTVIDAGDRIGTKTIGLNVFAETVDAIRFYKAHRMLPATITCLGPVGTQPATSE